MMIFSPFTLILVLGLVGGVKSWRFMHLNARKTVSSIVTASTLFLPLSNMPAIAAESLSSSERSAIENIERVIYSLKYMEDDIATKSDPDSVVTQAKFLLKNYRLKENLQTCLNIVPSSQRSEAKEHGQNAVEDLSQIYEYFSDRVDDMSGRKFAPQEVLQFAQEAIGATKKELKAVVSLYPQDLVREVDEQIRKEFTASEVDKVV